MRNKPPSINSTALAVAVGLFLTFQEGTIARPFSRESIDPKSQILSTNELQPLAEEAWQLVKENYFDANFNGTDWERVREEILSRRDRNREEVYATIRTMLARLDNPATRLLEPQQFAAFERENSGEYVGVGLPELLCIDIDEQTRHLTIVTPAPNTPASRAGLMPGDRVLAIDGAIALLLK